MPFVATPVKIPEDIRRVFSKFAKSRSFPARQVQRAKIILLAADGLNNGKISAQAVLGQSSVSKWRSRFLKILPLLQEATEKEPSHLEEVVSSLMIARVPYSPLITRMNRSLKSWRLPAVIRKNQGTRPAAEASTCL